VESTGGSVFNVNTIKAGELDLGFTQSDVQFNATKGVGQFKDSGAFGDLRAVFAVHPEPFTVVARKEANIAKFEDFKGKRFNVGNPGSGTRSSMEELLAGMGWKLSDFSLASELKADEHGPALCDGKIDGFYYAVGHPSANIQDPTTSCGACRTAAGKIEELRKVYGEGIRVQLKHYPLLNIHPWSLDAAAYADCAGEQGKFKEYAGLLFESQEKWARAAQKPKEFEAFSRGLNLDWTKMQACAAAPVTHKRIRLEMAEAEMKGLNATPTFFINGKRAVGPVQLIEHARNFDKLIRERN